MEMNYYDSVIYAPYAVLWENLMHLTVRMAWHDSGWNGKVCQYPVQLSSDRRTIKNTVYVQKMGVYTAKYIYSHLAQLNEICYDLTGHLVLENNSY